MELSDRKVFPVLACGIPAAPDVLVSASGCRAGGVRPDHVGTPVCRAGRVGDQTKDPEGHRWRFATPRAETPA